MHHPDQERRLEVFKVFLEGVLGDARTLRKPIQRHLLRGVPGQRSEQAVELHDFVGTELFLVEAPNAEGCPNLEIAG